MSKYLIGIMKPTIGTAVLISSALAGMSTAEAFTLGYSGFFGSTNSPATGASATVDVSFTDEVGGDIKMELVLTNTTGAGNPLLIGNPTTAGATDSEFLSVGFDFRDGDLDTELGFDASKSILGTTAFDELAYDDSSLNGGTSSSGGGWSNVSLNAITFDLALVTNGNLNSTGSPKDGLNAGESETVHLFFNPSGFSNAAELEQWFAAGFVEDGYLRTAARFKDVNAGAGSDKLLGGNLNPSPPNNPPNVPEPLTILATGVALGFDFLLRKGKQKNVS